MSQSPGKAPSEAEVQQIIDEVDLDGDGQINFNGEIFFFSFSSRAPVMPNSYPMGSDSRSTPLTRGRVHHYDDGPAIPAGGRESGVMRIAHARKYTTRFKNADA
jgi:hypothetical protein